MVFGNLSELREVLTNIIFNAVEALPKGGQITLRARPWELGEVRFKIMGSG
jgi:signal transduction histidine kinase